MSWTPKKNVLVPIDFSDLSLRALDEAKTIVASPEDLHIVHVLPNLSPMEPGVIWGEVNDESRADHVREALHEMVGDEIFNAAQIHVAFGDPGSEIAEVAKAVGAELIVMHSHGRTGPGHAMIGSTAERTTRHAHCPALILRD